MSNTSEANIILVGPVTPHPNADKLELTQVGGYQMVVGKGQFKEGDLAVFVQPDCVVPQTEPFKFIWQDHVGLDGTVPESRRRVIPRRFRKEWSEGLLMPVTELGFQIDMTGKMLGLYFNGKALEVGQDVAELLGITRYVEEFDRENTKADTSAAPRRKYPKSLRGWFYWTLRKLGFKNAGGRSYRMEVAFDFPVYDVNAYKHARNKFAPGEMVQVTEKIHGCNARYVFVPDKGTVVPETGIYPGTFYVGSHEQWKKDGPNVWWNVARQYPEIEQWCIANPGKVLYAEVGPCQKKGKVSFRYGAEEGETFVFTFDVYDPETTKFTWAGNEGMTQNAPILYSGPFDEAKILSLVDGASTVPRAKHLREGIVIRSLVTGQRLKIVSNDYLTLK